MNRARAFVFTINNYTDDDADAVKALASECKYVIAGFEVGEQGTPHIQGYVYFDSARTFKSVSKKIPRAHLDKARGSPVANKDYCGKDKAILIEHGELPAQGERNDLKEVIDIVKRTGRIADIVETAKSYQSIKMAEKYLEFKEEPRTWKPEVRWYHGSTGSGKTRAAREWLGDDVYTSLDSIKWWQGYDGHANVLIDDIRKDFSKFHQLLKLLDRYEYRVETKGGSRQFRARRIAITAPYTPEVMWEGREDVNQLVRRIDEIIQIGDVVQ